MSIKIRLSRVGRKNLPSYRIVVANTRDKRDGQYIDLIGHYNPSMNPESFDYDKKKYEEWVSKGAQVTDAVKKLIEGTYEYTPYEGTKDTGPEGLDHAAQEATDEPPSDKATDSKEEDGSPGSQSEPPEEE